MAKHTGAIALCAALAVLGGAATARAEIIYAGESLPGMGTCPDGNISLVMDPEQGRVIRVHAVDKAGQPSERCEFVGGGSGRLQNGMTVWLGWRSKVMTPVPNTRNVMFQAKCHGMHVADQPLVFEMRGGRLTLNNHEDINGVETPRQVWSTSLPLGTWFTILMKVHYSESRSEGSVELWYNGVKQTLANGTTIHHGQTWDGSENNVHWGIYRGATINGEAFHYLWRPRIATTQAEADPNMGFAPPPVDASVDGAVVSDAGQDAGGEIDAPATDGPVVDSAVADATFPRDAATASDSQAAVDSSGRGSSGGRGGAGGAGGRGGAGGASAPTGESAGCSCTLGGSRDRRGAAMLAVILLLAGLLCRRLNSAHGSVRRPPARNQRRR